MKPADRFPAWLLRPTARRAPVLQTALVLAAAVAHADTYSTSPNVPVPDGSASGLVSSLFVPAGTGRVLDVDVTVDLPGDTFGGWNGDLYLMLAHDGVASVLLNRVGRTTGGSFGYGDDGFVGLTLDDEATADIHVYQDDAGYPALAGGPISGSWQPDARAADPGSVTETDARGLFLGGFDHHEAAGEWRLFVADLSRGSQFVLENWSLTVTTAGAPVPDSGVGLLAAASLAWLGLAAWSRRSQRHLG